MVAGSAADVRVSSHGTTTTINVDHHPVVAMTARTGSNHSHQGSGRSGRGGDAFGRGRSGTAMGSATSPTSSAVVAHRSDPDAPLAAGAKYVVVGKPVATKVEHAKATAAGMMVQVEGRRVVVDARDYAHSSSRSLRPDEAERREPFISPERDGIPTTTAADVSPQQQQQSRRAVPKMAPGHNPAIERDRFTRSKSDRIRAQQQQQQEQQQQQQRESSSNLVRESSGVRMKPQYAMTDEPDSSSLSEGRQRQHPRHLSYAVGQPPIASAMNSSDAPIVVVAQPKDVVVDTATTIATTLEPAPAKSNPDIAGTSSTNFWSGLWGSTSNSANPSVTTQPPGSTAATVDTTSQSSVETSKHANSINSNHEWSLWNTFVSLIDPVPEGQQPRPVVIANPVISSTQASHASSTMLAADPEPIFDRTAPVDPEDDLHRGNAEQGSEDFDDFENEQFNPSGDDGDEESAADDPDGLFGDDFKSLPSVKDDDVIPAQSFEMDEAQNKDAVQLDLEPADPTHNNKTMDLQRSAGSNVLPETIEKTVDTIVSSTQRMERRPSSAPSPAKKEQESSQRLLEKAGTSLDNEPQTNEPHSKPLDNNVESPTAASLVEHNAQQIKMPATIDQGRVQITAPATRPETERTKIATTAATESAASTGRTNKSRKKKSDKSLETRRILLVKELRMAIATYGRYDVRCANISAALGDLLDESEDFEHAVKLHSDAVTIYSCKLGDDHPTTLNAKVRLGNVLENAQQYDEAVKTYFLVTVMQRTLNGEHCPAAADGLVCMAHALRKKGDYMQAIKELKRALKIYRDALGDSHEKVSSTVDEIASLYVTIGDFEKSAAILEEVVKLKAATLGPTSKEVALTLCTLATTYECSEEFTKSMKTLKKAYKIYTEINGYSSKESTSTLNRIAQLYEASGDYNRASIAYLGVLRGRKINLGPDHLSVGETYYRLGHTLRETGQLDKSLKCMKEALPIFVGKGVEMNDVEMIAEIMHEMACINKDKRQYQDAARIFKQEISVRRKIGQSEFPLVARALSMLGETEFELQNNSRALKHLVEALTIFQEHGEKGIDCAEVLYSTGLVFEAVRNRDRALEAFQEAARIYREHGYDASHARLLDAVLKIEKLRGKSTSKQHKTNNNSNTTTNAGVDGAEGKGGDGNMFRRLFK